VGDLLNMTAHTVYRHKFKTAFYDPWIFHSTGSLWKLPQTAG